MVGTFEMKTALCDQVRVDAKTAARPTRQVHIQDLLTASQIYEQSGRGSSAMSSPMDYSFDR